VSEATLDITDELLVAYVDDELSPAQRELVSSVLASNPALCRRAEEMRLARDLLQEAFPLRPGASIPASIEAAENRLAEACARRFLQPRVESLFHRRWKYAIAAGVVLCTAASASYVAWQAGSRSTRRPVTSLMRIDPETPLYRVLEFRRSAQLINVPAEDAAVRAILTFRTKHGDFCREFEIVAGSGSSTGIACRRHEQWHADVLLSAAAALPNGNFYTPASDADAPAINEVVHRLIDGDPLSADEAARLLTNRWRESEQK
jgi:hypothetical protein